MRVATTGRRGKVVATREEVGGEACSRASERVLEVKEGLRLEALLLHADGTRGQSSGSGKVTDPIRSFEGPPGGPQGLGGLALLGLAEPSWRSKDSEPIGLAPLLDPPPPLPNVNGSSNPGLSFWKSPERAKTLGLPTRVGLDNRGLFPLVMVRAQVEEARPALVSGQSPMRGPNAGIFLF